MQQGANTMELKKSKSSKNKDIANILAKHADRLPRESVLKWLDLLWDPVSWLFRFAKALVSTGLLFAVGVLFLPFGNEVPTFTQWVGFLHSPTFVVSTLCLTLVHCVLWAIAGGLTALSSQSKSLRKARILARRLGLYPPATEPHPGRRL